MPKLLRLAELTWLEVLSAVLLCASGFIFISLVIGNYLVFSPSGTVQAVGSNFLNPVYYLSVDVLHFAPFEEGAWAFSAFCFLLLSIAFLRATKIGMARSSLDSLTIVAPAVLIAFETGVYLLIPGYFFSQATNFIGFVGLGSVVTNWAVMVVSLAVVVGRLSISFGIRHRASRV